MVKNFPSLLNNFQSVFSVYRLYICGWKDFKVSKVSLSLGLELKICHGFPLSSGFGSFKGTSNHYYLNMLSIEYKFQNLVIVSL